MATTSSKFNMASENLDLRTVEFPATYRANPFAYAGMTVRMVTPVKDWPNHKRLVGPAGGGIATGSEQELRTLARRYFWVVK